MRTALAFTALCSSICVFGHAGKCYGDTTPPSFDDLLAGYAGFLSQMQTLKVNTLRKTHEKGGVYKDWTWTSVVAAKFVRYKGHWRFRERQIAMNYSDRPIPVDAETEAVFGLDGHRYVLNKLYVVPDKFNEASALARLDAGVASLKLRDASVLVARNDSSQQTVLGYSVQRKESRILYGYLPYDDNNPVVDLLRSCWDKEKPRTEDVDGAPTLVLQGHDRYGTHTLWLDPKANYAPRRIRTVKKGTDLFDKVAIGSITGPGDKHRKRPKLNLRELVFVARITLRRLSDSYEIAGFTSDELKSFEGGATYETKTQCTFENSDKTVEAAELAPTLEMPPGTVVTFQGEPAIRGEWRNGRPERVYDRKVLAAARWLGFGSPRSSRWAWIVFLSINILGALSLCIFFIRETLRRFVLRG